MTQANNGSEPSGSPAAANGGAGEGSSQAATDPFSGLDAGSREWVEKTGAKDVATLVKNARNAESLIGRSIQLPGKDAKPEEVDAYLAKATAPFRPEKPEGYELKLPDGLPENLPYDQDFAAKFKAVGHSLGLTAKQAAGIHDFYVKATADAFTKGATDTAAKAAAATEALQKEWGGPVDSPAFKQSATLANRALMELGGEPLQKALTDAGLLADGGIVLSPAIANALLKAGKALFADDDVDHGQSTVTGPNPFKDGPLEGNQTEMALMIKNDRQKALSMIRAAGRKPEEFGIKDAA